MPLISSLFATLERLGGRPVELYTFASDTDMWRYTSASRAVTVETSGLTYLPALIERGRLQRKDESGAVRVPIKLGRTCDVIDALVDVSAHRMSLGIHRHQTADEESVPVLIAFGDLHNVTFNPDGWVTADLVTAEESFREVWPTKIIEPFCQWQTYSPDCGVNEYDFRFTTTVTDRDRVSLTLSSVDDQADHYYSLGQFIYDGQRYFIESQLGTTIKIIGALPAQFDLDLALGPVNVTIIAGDDKKIRTCSQKFANASKFMGFPYLPALDLMKVGMT